MSQSEEIELLYKKLLGLPYSNPGAGVTQEVGNSKPFIQAGRIMSQTIPSGIVFPSQFVQDGSFSVSGAKRWIHTVYSHIVYYEDLPLKYKSQNLS